MTEKDTKKQTDGQAADQKEAQEIERDIFAVWKRLRNYKYNIPDMDDELTLEAADSYLERAAKAIQRHRWEQVI